MKMRVVTFLDHSHPCLDGDGNEISFVYPCAGIKDDNESPEPVSSVEIYLAAQKFGEGLYDNRITASDDLMAAIAEFCNHHDGKKTGMDCYGFVNLVGKKPQHPYKDCLLHWQRQDVKVVDIGVGDIVCFGNRKGFFAHAAICIAPDLFLSVYGIDCDLQFAPYAEMQKQYDLVPAAMRLT